MYLEFGVTRSKNLTICVNTNIKRDVVICICNVNLWEANTSLGIHTIVSLPWPFSGKQIPKTSLKLTNDL